ncbi:MAG: DUF2950 domain-containing protein [Candidatus Korobacteraceae bacterium]
MRSRLFGSFAPAITFVLVLVACLLPGVAAGQSQAAAPASAQGPKAFDTPQQAADAVIKAAGDYDVPQLMAIFGPDGEDFVSGGDPVQAKNNAIEFAKEAQAKNSITMESSKPGQPVSVVGQNAGSSTTTTAPTPNRAIIIVGDEEWPFPVPLIKKNGKWYFDAKVGRQNILYRRIGANELDAITVCRGYVEAQKEYAQTIHDDSGVKQYAQKIFSTPGKQDGLYWKNPDGTSAGPIGEPVAKALEEGYATGKSGFHGYYFKILKGQGSKAPGGAINYVIEGIMIGGFAMVAVPAEYRVTGVKTFIVSYEGTVYQKDLGPNSLEIVKQMELYNPDKTWQATDDQWPPNNTEQASSE